MTKAFVNIDTSLLERQRDRYALLARDLLVMGDGVEAMKMQAIAAQYRDWVRTLTEKGNVA
jgi:hypothetical protein